MVRTLGFALVASLAFAGATFAAVCPSNQANAVGLGTPQITAAVWRDSSCTNGFCWKSQWNNTLGTAHLNAIGPGCSSELSATTTDIQTTADDFVISGPAGPVSFQVSLTLANSATSFAGSMQGSLSDGTQTSSIGYTAGTATRTLQLNLSRNVGTHFTLTRIARVDAACTSTADLNTTLTIVLPPGYNLTSCYGYTVSGPVPALQASWGKVKTIYR